MKHREELHYIDRLSRMSDLAAAIEIGLIGLRECNSPEASQGFGLIADQLHDGLREVVEELLAEEKRERKLRAVT